LLDAGEIKDRFPPFSPDPETVAVHEERAGFVRPEETVQAHLDLAASLGADLRFEEPVLSWEASGKGVRVETHGGSYEAEQLVISPGAWAPQLLADLGLPLEVTRQVMYWFEPTSGLEPFLPDRFPIFIWEPEDGAVFYGIPDGLRGGVKAGFHHVGGEVCTPETLDREVRDAEISRIRERLATHIPDLAGRCLEAKACMYTNTPDEHFVISAHPELEQVTIACGFSGHGYKFCSVVGEILADLVTEGSTRHPIELFSPTRLEGSAKG
jgi:sarcosine oxidase